MSADSADANASTATASERRSSGWDTRPVQPEWGGQVRGLALLLLGQVVGGAILGMILYGSLRLTGAYFPLVGPVVFGLALGALAREMAKRSGFDNFIVGAVCVGLGALVTMGSFHAGRYGDFLSRLDAVVQKQAPQRIRTNVRKELQVPPDTSETEFQRMVTEYVNRKNQEAAERGEQSYVSWVKQQTRDEILRTDPSYYGIGTDSFGGYLMREAQTGIVTRLGRDLKARGWDLGVAGNLAYRALEVVLMAGIGIFFLVPTLLTTPRTKESQNRLPVRVPLVFLSPDNPDAIRNQVGLGGVAELDKGLQVEPGKFPAVEVAVRTPSAETPVSNLKETGEPEVVIEVSWVNQTARGDLRHRRLGWWWYPTGVLAAVEKQFGAAPPLASYQPKPDDKPADGKG